MPPFWSKPEERRGGRRAQGAGRSTVPDVGSVRERATSVPGGEQIGHGDRLVAVWAGTTRAEATGEGVAVRAALLGEEAAVAGRADVDGGRARRAVRDRRQCGGMA